MFHLFLFANNAASVKLTSSPAVSLPLSFPMTDAPACLPSACLPACLPAWIAWQHKWGRVSHAEEEREEVLESSSKTTVPHALIVATAAAGQEIELMLACFSVFKLADVKRRNARRRVHHTTHTEELDLQIVPASHGKILLWEGERERDREREREEREREKWQRGREREREKRERARVERWTEREKRERERERERKIERAR
jgi:hypothetical protein